MDEAEAFLAEISQTSQWLLAGLVVLAGLVLGLLIDRLLVPWLLRALLRAFPDTRKIVADSLRGSVLLWVLLLAMGVVLLVVRLPPWLDATLGVVLQIVAVVSLCWVLLAMATDLATGPTVVAESEIGSNSIFLNIVRTIVIAGGLLGILQLLGFQVTPFLATLGISAIVVGLALQDTLSNLFSGVFLIAAGQIRRGDVIELSTGEQGVVTDINWRNTTLHTIANNSVITPNAKLASDVVTNYSMPEEVLSVLVEFSVAIDSDLEQVERLALEVAREVLHQLPNDVVDFEPLVRFQGFSEWAMRLLVIVRCERWSDQFLVRHELIKRLHRRFADEGIQLPTLRPVLDLPERALAAENRAKQRGP